MEKIDVVIVNWNTGSFLSECLVSLINYGENFIKDIIVVDNLSTDNSLDRMPNHSKIKLVKNDANLGFSKGCNIGAEFCEAKYILFLNPDARIYEDTLDTCIKFHEKEENKNIGILGAKLEDNNGEISSRCCRFPSAKNIFFHSVGIDRLFPSLGSFMIEFDHQSTRIVDQVIGAFFMVKKDVFDQLEGFDERFFLYMDEVDFSLRANEIGFRSIFLSNALAFHYGEVSSSSVKAKRLFYSLRSRVQYSIKHFGRLEILSVLLSTYILELFTRILESILFLRFENLKNTIKAYTLLYRWTIRKDIIS